jgi:hypothetical protein
MHPTPKVMADRHEKSPRKIIELLLTHSVWSALPISGGGHWCANIHIANSPINWSLQNRNGNCRRKDDNKIKKQTDMDRGLNRLQTVARLPVPLPFHYPLPVSMKAAELVSKVGVRANAFMYDLW